MGDNGPDSDRIPWLTEIRAVPTGADVAENPSWVVRGDSPRCPGGRARTRTPTSPRCWLTHGTGGTDVGMASAAGMTDVPSSKVRAYVTNRRPEIRTEQGCHDTSASIDSHTHLSGREGRGRPTQLRRIGVNRDRLQTEVSSRYAVINEIQKDSWDDDHRRSHRLSAEIAVLPAAADSQRRQRLPRLPISTPE